MTKRQRETRKRLIELALIEAQELHPPGEKYSPRFEDYLSPASSNLRHGKLAGRFPWRKFRVIVPHGFSRPRIVTKWRIAKTWRDYRARWFKLGLRVESLKLTNQALEETKL